MRILIPNDDPSNYPELRGVPRDVAWRWLKCAWRDTRRRTVWRRRVASAGLLGLVVCYCAAPLLIEKGGWWFGAGIVLVMMVVGIAVVSERSGTKRALRERLAAERASGRFQTCLECGYNLRGVASDACPECGASRLVREWEKRV